MMSYEDEWNDAYYVSNGKGKGKHKGKKGMWTEAYANGLWKGKSKGKGKSKDPLRSVNAYASDMFVGGLEILEANAAESPKPVTQPHVGMLDSGATASAAPDAVVQGLISAVLSHDSKAKIELDQGARPYFRFGNGRWGRALCRVHISSMVSGSNRTFSIYTLPNPPEYFQSGYEQSSLVPVLIGMDFMGVDGAGMLVDFATGFAMITTDPKPEIFRLDMNHKGHYTLDIVQYLTQGSRCEDGHPHVIVRSNLPKAAKEHHAVLHLGTVWFDLARSEREMHERDEALAHERMWRLFTHSRPAPAASLAQMCGPLDPVPSSTSSSRFLAPHVSFADGSGGRPRDREDSSGGSKGESQCSQGQSQTTRQGPLREDRPTRPSSSTASMALHGTPHNEFAPVEHARPVDRLCSVQCAPSVHSPRGIQRAAHDNGQSQHDWPHASRTTTADGRSLADGTDLQAHAGQDQCRGSPTSSDLRGDQPDLYVIDGAHGNTNKSDHSDANDGDTNNGVPRISITGNDRELGGSSGPRGGRRGACGGLRERAGRDLNSKDSKATALPLHVGRKVMALTGLMMTACSALLLDLHLHDRDGLWEIACAPHSWLSAAAEEHGLKPQRINLASGFDLYQKETWARLRELRVARKPRRLWISLPCTKWCPWTSVNFNTPEKKVQLETARRRERRLLWEANKFIKEAVESDPEVQVYFEWPHPCYGWKQAPMQDLEGHLESRGIPWLSCRIDGCNYGMRNQENSQFIRKQWLVRTTDERFHKAFRAKICPGNHGPHSTIEGNETSRTAYYPWRMVQAIARHWRDQSAPTQHIRLLQQRADVLELQDHTEIADDDVLEYLEEETGMASPEEKEMEEAQMVEAERICMEARFREARLREQFSMDQCEALLLEFVGKAVSDGKDHSKWSQKPPFHMLLGAYSHGAFSGVTRNSSRYPELNRYINSYLRHWLPDCTWSSVLLCLNGKALPHKDTSNLKKSYSVLHGLGTYSGGGLWVQYPRDDVPAVRRRVRDGTLQTGHVKETNRQFVFFDPDVPHATQAWTGKRLVLTAYTSRMRPTMSTEDERHLQQLCFPKFNSDVYYDRDYKMNMAVEDGGRERPAVPEESAASKEEQERWEAQISKFHKAAGHPTNRNMARIIKDAGHEQWKVKMALQHRCQACESLKQGGTSSGQVPPAATHPLYAAWEAVGVDSGEWVPPGSKRKVKFLLFMDLATKLRAVCPLFEYDFLEMRAESGDDFVKAFSERWLGAYPKPRLLVMDSAKSFVSENVHNFASNANIQISYAAEKESWSHGVLEAGVQDLKTTAAAIHLESLDQEYTTTLFLATSALNSTEYTAGFSAFQWAFGKEYSVTDEDVRTFANADYKGEFLRLVQAREKAEAIAKTTRAKRVLTKLGNTTVRQPLRQFSPMDLVKVWRKVWPQQQFKGPRGGFKKSGRPHWIGPGRVVFHEVLPHQETGDERRHVVWVLIGTQLLRCSVHSVRPVTETERFQFETSGTEDFTSWKTLADILPRREYHDLVDQMPAEDEVELPNLPQEPGPSTMIQPTRRVVRKTTLMPTTTTVFEETGQLPAQSTSTASTSPVRVAPSEVNDYESPEAKRPKTANWVEDMYVEAEAEEKDYKDLFTAFQETAEFMKIEFDLEEPRSIRQKKAMLRNPMLYLVKKMKDSEVVLSRLSERERQLFHRAKLKEVDSFIKNEAVRKCLDDEETRRAFDSNRIVKARWVLTWKLVPPEEQSEAVADHKNNPNTVHVSDGTKKAKARIVLLGFQHPSLLDPTFKTASPVQSMLGRNLLYAMAADSQWRLEGLDLATAFLQTQPTEADQELWTTGVKELRDALGIDDNDVMRILRNIYGSTTAPRGLWLSLHKRLVELGAQPVLGERCLWIWLSAERRDGHHAQVIGAMGGHVDDFHRIGDDSDEWKIIKEKINGAYKWGMAKSGSYRHAGTDVSTVKDDRGYDKIIIDQSYYIESIMDVDIDPSRLGTNVAMNKHDVDACRTALGALQWVAIQTQPQICARCNLLLTDLVTSGNMETAREIQQLVSEVRREPFKLVFQKFEKVKHWRDMVFISMGDQAHANRPKGDSTGGLITLIAGPESTSGAVCPMSVIGWRTWKLKRKAIGSNDAEVQSILEAEDHNFRARLLWSELHGAAGSERERSLRVDMVDIVENQIRDIKGILCTDSKGGYDAVEVNESPLLGLSNMRAALQAFQLRGNLQRAACELRWLASDFDLADALTKKRQDCREGLLKFLRTGFWCIKYDPSFTSAKKGKKAGRTAVGTVQKFLEAPDSFMSECAADPFWGWCNM